RINVDIDKKVNPLTLWTETVSYTITELLSAQQLGRPIDSQMLAGLNLKHQMDVDQMVYVGDPSISATGLINAALVGNTGNVAAGAANSL
ncbi:major capsid family protein, partial [Acinetobacter baumannii]